MEFEPMLTPREKSPLPENVPRGVSNPRHFGSEPKHYQLSYSGPQLVFSGDVLGWVCFSYSFEVVEGGGRIVCLVFHYGFTKICTF